MVIEDPKSGWNVHAMVDGFEFAPRQVGSDPVDGEGHLHLYVDGQRITRMYGPWWHIAALEPGTREIVVEVSANNHQTYGSAGQPVTAAAMVEVDASMAMADGDEPAVGEGHEHDDAGTGQAMDMGAAEADVVIEASLSDGDLTIDDRRFAVELGSTVGVIVEADVEEQVHIHGYDLLVDVGPGNPVDLSFLADSPGTFEIELEQSGRFLFEIQVR